MKTKQSFLVKVYIDSEYAHCSDLKRPYLDYFFFSSESQWTQVKEISFCVKCIQIIFSIKLCIQTQCSDLKRPYQVYFFSPSESQWKWTKKVLHFFVKVHGNVLQHKMMHLYPIIRSKRGGYQLGQRVNILLKTSTCIIRGLIELSSVSVVSAENISAKSVSLIQ